MVNETLCKVLCHNLVVLIHEMYELGIDPVFCNQKISLASGPSLYSAFIFKLYPNQQR
jgi:hypothetical protein